VALRDLAARRRDTQRIIGDDPTTVTIYRRGATPDDAETTFEFTGRLQPRRAMFAQGAMGVDRVEGPAGLFGWVLLAPHDTPVLLARDDAVIGSQHYRVAYCAKYSYKLEAFLEEAQ